MSCRRDGLRGRDAGHRQPGRDQVVADHPRRPRVPAVATDQAIVQPLPGGGEQIRRSLGLGGHPGRDPVGGTRRQRPRRPSAAPPADPGSGSLPSRPAARPTSGNQGRPRRLQDGTERVSTVVTAGHRRRHHLGGERHLRLGLPRFRRTGGDLDVPALGRGIVVRTASRRGSAHTTAWLEVPPQTAIQPGVVAPSRPARAAVSAPSATEEAAAVLRPPRPPVPRLRAAQAVRPAGRLRRCPPRPVRTPSARPRRRRTCGRCLNPIRASSAASWSAETGRLGSSCSGRHSSSPCRWSAGRRSSRLVRENSFSRPSTSTASGLATLASASSRCSQSRSSLS